MASYGSMAADAGTVGLRYARRLVSGIPGHRAARFSAPGGHLVVANHPVFILGHLCLYPARVGQFLGVDASSMIPPDVYNTLFSKDAQCRDDVHGDIYPAFAEIVDFYVASYERALEIMRGAKDDQLSVENPVDSPIKQVCPTLGSMLTFYLTGHVSMHLGQLSTWRRMEGLPPA